MKFSAVIPTLNEDSYLLSCIDALERQSYAFSEIIVVDASSLDHTRKIAETMNATVFFSNSRNPGRQRNLGARLSKGEIVVFVDADTVVSRNLVEEFHRIFTNDRRVVGLFPKLLPRNGKKVDECIFWFLRNGMKLGSSIGLPLAPGACCAYRKQPFLEAGGFVEGIAKGEDSELSMRMKGFGKVEGLETCCARTSVRRLSANGRLTWMRNMIAITLPLVLMAFTD